MKTGVKTMEIICPFCAFLRMILRSCISPGWPGNLFRIAAMACCVIGAGANPASAFAKSAAITHVQRVQHGEASVYVPHGKLAMPGAKPDPNAMRAAHRTLPFGTLVRVTNAKNGRHVLVRINDRGPYVKGRIIDLTPAAARKLGYTTGHWRVTVTVVPRHGRPAITRAAALPDHPGMRHNRGLAQLHAP
jgi:rare lipoprotein A